YFAPEAVDDYLRCYLDPATVHAACEDYRAGATYDFALDQADRAAGRRISCPVLALWAGRGALPQWYDVRAIWRDWADDVRGQAIDSGHFLAEEAGDETSNELRRFFAG
ncbi:MAG: alpha/beta hydrolase, partial [Chloroflexi bacterium]|nr:alpha/beta hydrolase [Chloroflexota bacterium]